ncbi:MAG TPA: SDR family oxidoreductase [Anaerolineales bacterium]|nr:SDR family oxidoreductase [Anaerolineales bacterium]
MQKPLEGQVCLVTGAAQGLGQVTALALSHAGAAVGVTDIDAVGLAETVVQIEEAGGRVMSHVADISDPQSARALAIAVEHNLGPLDLLVNNAATLGPVGLPWDVDTDEYWRTFVVNMRGSFLITRAFLPGMLERRRGRIIDVVSGAASLPYIHCAAYANSKSALVAWTNSLGTAVKEHGICVFAINPGQMTTRTGMGRLVAERPEHKRFNPEVAAMLARGGGEPPETAAHLIVRLATGEADILTGRYIGVHDDLDAMLRRSDEILRGDLYTLRIRKLAT